MATNKTSSKSQKQSGAITGIFRGRIITSDFFIRHWSVVALVCCMMLIYIHNRYECTTRMEQIQRLEKQLEIDETELMRERATYMSRIRESSMTEMIQRHNLGLKIQEQPPYHVNIVK